MVSIMMKIRDNERASCTLDDMLLKKLIRHNIGCLAY